MQVEKSSEQLVHEVPIVLVGQDLLRVDQPIQISLHLFGNDVDVLIIGNMWRLLDINKLDNILVVEKL
jgi:hypothetical protein